MSDADKLRQLAAKATPGRWKLWANEVRADTGGNSMVDDSTLVCTVPMVPLQGVPDAYYIAEAQPQNVLALLDERDRLRAAARTVANELRRYGPGLMPAQATVREWENRLRKALEPAS